MVNKILKGLWEAVLTVFTAIAYYLLTIPLIVIFLPLYFFVLGCPLWIPLLCILVFLGEASPWCIPISLAGLVVAWLILKKTHMIDDDAVEAVWGKPLRTDSWGRILPERAKRRGRPRKRKPKAVPEKTAEAAERESGKEGGNGDAA